MREVLISDFVKIYLCFTSARLQIGVRGGSGGALPVSYSSFVHTSIQTKNSGIFDTIHKSSNCGLIQ